MSVSATWLGQSGLVLEAEGQAIVVDPWLSPNPARAVPPVTLERWPEKIHAVLITHGHGDHLDMPALSWLSGQSEIGRIIAPAPHVAGIRAALPGVEIIRVKPGDRVPGDSPVAVLPAWHGVAIEDGYSAAIGADGTSPHVGFALILGGVSLYIAGDTIVAPELVPLVRAEAPDVVFLPVNGRDSEREARGLLGNMDPVEAFAFADAVGADSLVPLHHDGVTGNTCDVADIARAGEASRIHLLLPARGRPLTLGGRSS